MPGRPERRISRLLDGRRLLASVLVLAVASSAAAGPPAEPREVHLVVTESGDYLLAGRPVALADLQARLRELKAGGGPIDLHVTAGPQVAYRYLAPAMQIVQEEGLAKTGVLTVAPAESGSH